MQDLMTDERQHAWLGYEAHVARQKGFKARKPRPPLTFGPLAAAFALGFGVGGAILGWAMFRQRPEEVPHADNR
jgi:hypothetical protein